MGRKSEKQKVLEEYPFLKNYINERWSYYSDPENTSWEIFDNSQESIAYNIMCDIENDEIYTEEKAQLKGID